MKDFFKKRYIRLLLVIFVAVVLAFIVELGFQFKVINLNQSRKGNIKVDISDCKTSDLDKNDNGTLSLKAGESGTISFAVNGYVDRLVVSYDSKGVFTENVTVEYRNMYGKSETKEISDVNPVYLNESVINIRKNVYNITLKISDNPYDITIKGITVRNVAVINWIRVFYFILGFISLGMIVVLRDVIVKKVQIAFAIVAGAVGLSFVISMPLVRVGFDEEAHFRNSFILSVEGTTVENETLWNMLNTVDENHPAVRTGSYEEYKAFYNYLNKYALYRDNGKEPFRTTARTTSGMASFAYIFMALGMSVARLFRMGFANIYILGRLINLTTYVVVMYFAIKNIKKGKLLLAVIGLMPTITFLSASISYDPVVISFIALGLSYFLNGLVEDEEINWKNYILGCGFLGFGCLAKAIYAPLFLIGLLYPATKFKDKKTKNIMKSGYVVCFLVLLATAVLPMALGKDGGDNRGGDTSHVGQLSYMFSNLIGYFGLMFKSIGHELQSFSVGTAALDELYFFGAGHFIVLIDVLLALVVFTQGSDGFLYKKKDRILIPVFLFMIVALIWTSLYMAFTEPGIASVINGVQGRYFIPILFLGCSLFATPKIKCEWDKTKFYPTVFMIMSAILSFEIYSQVILNSCG